MSDLEAMQRAWSPHGSRVAFASDRGGTYEIRMIDAEVDWPDIWKTALALALIPANMA